MGWPRFHWHRVQSSCAHAHSGPRRSKCPLRCELLLMCRRSHFMGFKLRRKENPSGSFGLKAARRPRNARGTSLLPTGSDVRLRVTWETRLLRDRDSGLLFLSLSLPVSSPFFKIFFFFLSHMDSHR